MLCKVPPASQLGHAVWSASNHVPIGGRPNVLPRVKPFGWKLLSFVIAAGSLSLGNIARAEGSDVEGTDAEDADEDEDEDKDADENDDDDKSMSARDRRAWLKQEVPIPMDPLAWCVKLHLEHGFTQVEICDAHNVSARTLTR